MASKVSKSNSKTSKRPLGISESGKGRKRIIKTKAPVIDILTRKPLVIVESRKPAKAEVDENCFAELICKFGIQIAAPLKLPASSIGSGEFNEDTGLTTFSRTKTHMLFAVAKFKSRKVGYKILDNEDLLDAKSFGICEFYKVYRKGLVKLNRHLVA